MVVMDNKKIIDVTLEQKLKRDELGTVEMLREVISKIIRQCGDITDTTVKVYNACEDADYNITISISTIRNYLKRYGYVIKKDVRECIVREIGFPEYLKIRDILDNDNASFNQKDKATKSVAEQLAFGYLAKADYYSKQRQQAIRYSSNVQDRLAVLCTKYPMFSKQYLLSYLLDTALDILGE